MDFRKYLYDRILSAINEIDEEIYAISFYIHTNELGVFNGIPNFPEFWVTSNTEEGCGHAPADSEERWNIAYWYGEEYPVIDPTDEDGSSTRLLEWYREQDIGNLGEDNPSDWADYRGPVGYYELISLAADIARELQTEGIISRKFGRIPIIIQELEPLKCFRELAIHANPDGEADDYIAAFDAEFAF